VVDSTILNNYWCADAMLCCGFQLISYCLFGFAMCSVYYSSVPTKILMCLHVPKKSAVLACLTMSKNGISMCLTMESTCAQQKHRFAEKNLLNGISVL